jgi:hypothetical protein
MIVFCLGVGVIWLLKNTHSLRMESLSARAKDNHSNASRKLTVEEGKSLLDLAKQLYFIVVRISGKLSLHRGTPKIGSPANLGADVKILRAKLPAVLAFNEAVQYQLRRTCPLLIPVRCDARPHLPRHLIELVLQCYSRSPTLFSCPTARGMPLPCFRDTG